MAAASPPRMSRTQRTALLGLVVNIALAMLKLVAGIVGHCYALIADAVESLADILGSVVIWGGLHIGARPADEKHPWGHGKAESLAALVVAAMVFAAGVGIAVKAIDEILTPHHRPAAWTLIVLIVVIVAKTMLGRYTARVARQEGSGAVEVDAWHHWGDAITSGAALIGITIAVFGEHVFAPAEVAGVSGVGGWAQADDWAALLASGIIVYNAWRMARVPLHELMDAEPEGILEEARRITLEVEGVRGIEKTRARTSGGRHYLEMHVEVDPAMSVADAHVITGKIKAAVRARAGAGRVADVLVHVEPWSGGEGRDRVS